MVSVDSLLLTEDVLLFVPPLPDRFDVAGLDGAKPGAVRPGDAR